jgi:hypothetical protein
VATRCTFTTSSRHFPSPQWHRQLGHDAEV